MRRLVVVLIAAALALTISGCGGGGEEPASTANPATVPAAPVVPAVAAPGVITDRSAISTETFVPFVVENTPAEVQKRLDTKQAMLLFFYNTAQLETDDLRTQINQVINENRGNIDLLTYDLSKYTSMDASGNIRVSGKLLEDKKATEAVRFARAAKVDHVPYIIIIDDQGYEIFWSRGFIDAELLGRQVQRANR